VDTLSYKTQSAKKEGVERKWHIIDAEGEVVGRMCTKIASVLRGKHKPSYTPHVDTGDYVIVINAGKVRFTGNKLNQKEYQRYSGYPGGQKSRTAKEMLDKKPIGVVEAAVRGMLPKNRLGRAMFKKLFVYEGAEHPHEAQKPEKLEL
jgi:large subunit ribosomal protein L13